MTGVHTVFQYIAIERLEAGSFQPRKTFEPKALEELAQSIRTQGLIEPLIVRLICKETYEIIAGERRFRAAKLAGLNELPCLIGRYSDEQACALSLIENIQREDLNLIEEANAYRRLIDEFHYQQDEIAILMGKSRSHIANILRLLNLTSKIKSFISDGALSLGQARVLVGLVPNLQEFFAERAIEQQWSVRQLEAVIRKTREKSTVTRASTPDKDIERLQRILSEQLGTPVEVSKLGQGGWLKLQYFDNDTLEGLLDRLGLRYD